MIPRRDGVSLPRVFISVTCPMSLDEAGMMILPWARTSCATSARTCEPGVSLPAFTEFVNSARTYIASGWARSVLALLLALGCCAMPRDEIEPPNTAKKITATIEQLFIFHLLLLRRQVQA